MDKIIMEPHQEETIEWVAEQMPGGFFIYHDDDKQEIIYVNQATCRIFGCDTVEEFRVLTGNTFPGMVHPNDRARVLSSIDNQIAYKENNDMDNVEYRIIRKDGSIRYIKDYGHHTETIEHGSMYYVFIVDVTEERHAKEAEAANRAKTAFLTNMSHDIRTPMNAIVGFTDLALLNITDQDQVREYLEKIKLSGEHLLLLINDVLEMSRIESGSMRLNPAPVRLSDIMDNLCSIIKGEMDNKHQELYVDLSKITDELIICDKLRLDQILLNLVSNAIKYTQEGGRITVSIAQGVVREDGKYAYLIRIKDDGPGMSADFAEKVFEPFERERNTTDSNVSGSGLGLAITKRIVEMMGGSISLKTVPGEGAEFIVKLVFEVVPVMEEEKCPPEKKRISDDDFKGRSILLVEDIVVNREIALAMLSIYGFKVEVACDGVEAVEKISSREDGYYDAILMDIDMPRMNGYEATRAIRNLPNPRARKIPILALTANAFAEDKQKAIEAGMNAHIAKPIDRQSLIDTLGKFL